MLQFVVSKRDAMPTATWNRLGCFAQSGEAFTTLRSIVRTRQGRVKEPAHLESEGVEGKAARPVVDDEFSLVKPGLLRGAQPKRAPSCETISPPVTVQVMAGPGKGVVASSSTSCSSRPTRAMQAC